MLQIATRSLQLAEDDWTNKHLQISGRLHIGSYWMDRGGSDRQWGLASSCNLAYHSQRKVVGEIWTAIAPLVDPVPSWWRSGLASRRTTRRD